MGTSYEQVPRSPAELTFLFSDHAFNNYPRILDALEGVQPDIVAVELVGESEADRDSIEREVNAQLRGEPANPDIEIGWFEEDVIARFAGSDIRYTLIDTPSNTGAWDYHVRSIHHLNEYGEQSDAAQRRYHAAQFMAYSALSMSQREQLTADTLTHLARQHPGKRIAAVVGMMHTGLQRRIGSDITSSRQFITTAHEKAELQRGQKARFSAHEAGRRAYLYGSVTIDEMIAATVDDQGFLRDYQA